MPADKPARPAPRKRAESKVEAAKKASKHLRGTIAQVLAADDPAFEHDDIQALKFHGVYQQEDRDDRGSDKKDQKGKRYLFMVRTKLPGGKLSAAQYLALDALADAVTWNKSLRITTRQGFQFHGIIKGDLKQTITRVNQALVSTLAACGDVERNVMASPAPIADDAHRTVQRFAEQIAAEMAPATRAYFELWVDGEKIDGWQQPHPEAGTGADEEPFYGDAYLPRKFKTGITLPQDNSIEVYSQDCGLIAIVRDGKVAGANVLVGGGFGLTHRKSDTFARLGSPLGFVDADDVVKAVKVVAAIFRDEGNRADRRHARLKYLIEEWGMDRFRAEFEKRAAAYAYNGGPFSLKPWVELPPLEHKDYLGRHDQGDGRSFYGVWIPNGRIIDTDGWRAKTALRTIVERTDCRVILTPDQSLLLADLDDEQVAFIEKTLTEHGVKLVHELSGVRRYSMACPALPTCGLALAESERYLPQVISELEVVFEKLGLSDEPLTVRSTGCPNGCARPYTADIAFVGRKPEVYDIYVGGRLAGDRMAELYAENVESAQLVPTLQPLLEAWARGRRGDESFGDFYNRVFADGAARQIVTGSKDDPSQPRVLAALGAN
jgi:sulfite reductase (ferredoxin)